MIKILILTDDVYEWADKIVEDLPNTQSRIDTNKKSARIWNDVFTFQILDEIETYYTEQFNTMILDKFIDKNDLDIQIKKLLLPNDRIHKTKRYKIWESCADMLGTEINSMLRLFPIDSFGVDITTVNNIRSE